MSNSRTGKRHVGIELGRILAMLMICILHVLGMGGLLGSIGNQWNGHYVTAYLLESFSFSAVNIYVLISGYVSLKSTVSYKKLLSLWLQVLFYSVFITAVFAILSPSKLSDNEWLKAFTPISHNQYWFMTCYFGLMFFAPIFNKGIQSLSERELFSGLVGGFILFSLIPTLFRQEYFGLSNGYSVLWMLFLYVLGACLRRFDMARRLNVWIGILGVLVSTAVTFLLFTRTGPQEWSYTTPTVVLQAIFFFVLCLKIHKVPPLLESVVLKISSLTLGVYLTHVHPLVFVNIIPLIAIWVGMPSLESFTVKIFVMATLIFMFGIFLESIRQFIFKCVGRLFQ